jgi:hypothetical protein
MSQEAVAGMKFSTEIYVDTFNKYASGGLGGVRNSTTSNDYIGCGVYQWLGSVYVGCEAQDAAGNYVSCWSNDPAQANAALGISTDAHLQFLADSSGACQYIVVSGYSWSEPKRP